MRQLPETMLFPKPDEANAYSDAICMTRWDEVKLDGTYGFILTAPSATNAPPAVHRSPPRD